jgi:hypothetical protein
MLIQLFCTMKHCKKIVNIKNNYKGLSLAELYNFAFNVNIENAHNSYYDVINLHKIIVYLSSNNKLDYNIK